MYVFWLGFAGLIFYLRREDKREGYPLVSDRSRSIKVQGFPNIPTPKTFLTQHGPVYAPRAEVPDVINARVAGKWLGAPLDPTGDPMLAAMGPGSYAQHRADIPDYTFDDNLPKIVPLRSVPEFFLAWEDPNVIGMAVFGDDGVQAGTVSDALGGSRRGRHTLSGSGIAGTEDGGARVAPDELRADQGAATAKYSSSRSWVRNSPTSRR